MTELRVGCPMWVHRPWLGRFYPAGSKPGTELGLYASWCNAVEGNTTFYAQPTVETVTKWCKKRLNDVATEARSFLGAIEPLGPRIGPIQVQLPA